MGVKKMNALVSEIDLRDIEFLYEKLGIDTTQHFDIERLSKEYQDLMASIEKEALTTSAYINR